MPLAHAQRQQQATRPYPATRCTFSPALAFASCPGRPLISNVRVHAHRMKITEMVAQEVQNLHQFFELWFNGVVSKTADTFTRVTSAWSEPFTLVDPTNQIHTSASLLSDTFDFHGSFPNLLIQIHKLSVSATDDYSVAVALYEERHINGIETEVRLCSATFVRQEISSHGTKWLHIHESSHVPHINVL